MTSPVTDVADLRTSILLVKPDGVADRSKVAFIAECIAAAPLLVTERLPLQLSATDVENVWPKFAHAEHAFTRRMLALYMSTGPCEAVFVDGSDVVSACRAVRARVRQRFGDAAFENAIHTPTDLVEVMANLAYLRGHRSDYVRHVDPSAGTGRFGRLLQLREEGVTALAEELWARRVRHGWDTFRQRSPSAPGPALYLQAGSPNSIDFEISAIAEAFPERNLDWCAERLLEAERFGQSQLPVRRHAVAATVERLAGYGLHVVAGESPTTA